MSLESDGKGKPLEGAPRVSGDEPRAQVAERIEDKCSPRERG